MPKIRSIAILAPLVLVLSLFFTSAASAQQGQAWMPSFDPAQHCYLDPQLNDSVDLSGCEQKLKDLGKSHGYQFYFIMTVQAGEKNGSKTGQKFAAWKLDQYVLTLGKKLPADKYVIILLVRPTVSSSQKSLAAQGGDDLQKLKLDDKYFNDPQSGPLAKNAQLYLPNNPKGFALAVAGDVNAATDSIIAAQKQREDDARRQAQQAQQDAQRRAQEAQQAAERQAEEARRQAQAQAEHDRQMHKMLLVVGIGLPLSAVLVLICVLALRRKSWRGKALARIAKVKESLDSSNTFYQKLHKQFGEFLDDRKNWRSTFDPHGVTFPAYEKAVNAYSEFSVRNMTALSLVEKAEKLVAGAPAWKVWTIAEYTEAIDILTSREVEVTGDEVELTEVKKVTGGTLKKTTYKPETLLDSIDALFNDANTGLQGIYDSFQKSDKNKKEIESLLGTVDATKEKLTGAGLVMDPYKQRYDELKKSQQSFLAIIDNDPLKACASSVELQAGIKQLEGALERALSFKLELDGTTQATIDRAAKRVSDARAQTVQYHYPLVGSEAAPEKLAETKYLFNEEGANPDQPLAKARQAFARAVEAVRNADLDGAAAARAEAEQVTGEVDRLIEGALKVKALVEQNVPLLRANLEKLSESLPEAIKALDSLKAEFLEVNFRDEPEKLSEAQALVATGATAELAKIKSYYDRQSYSAAYSRVLKLGPALEISLAKVPEVGQCLVNLRSLKEHSKSTVAAARQLSEKLVDKLKTNEFTTSADTDNTFAHLAPRLADQQDDVGKKVTDWPAASSAADKLFAECRQVDSAIDAQKTEHGAAEAAVQSLAAAITSAQGYVKDPATLQPACDKLAEARSSLASLQKRIAVKKSDWSAISSGARQATATATNAEQLARADRRNYDEAVAGVQALATAVSSAQTYVSNSATRQPAIDKMSEARTALANVQSQVSVPKSDWAAIARRAKEGLSLANNAAEMAKADRRAYEDATVAIRSLSSAIDEADGYVNDSTTRQPAATKLQQARQALSDCQSKLGRRQADWSAIAASAREAIATANSAGELARADRRAYDEAANAINSAVQTIRGTQTQYDRGVMADLSQANSQLRYARTALSNGEYNDARDYAQAANSAAANAVSVALAAVAAIIAEEQRLAELERQRQAELERQRQAELDRQERARQAELDRQERERQAELERQRQAERDRQAALELAALEAARERNRSQRQESNDTSTSQQQDDSGRSGQGSGDDDGKGRSGDGVGDF
jgi:hypothetical protein